MIKKHVLYGLVFICLLPNFAYSAIYRYVDSDGHTVYSNVPVGKMKPVKLPGLSVYDYEHKNNQEKKSMHIYHQHSKYSASTGGGSRQNVDERTQEGRDNLRKKILKQELDNERKALDDAKQTLVDKRKSIKNAEKLKKFQDMVTEREKNISALERELSNSK